MKTTPLPIDSWVSDGASLYSWLGTFWTRLYENPEFARNYEYGQALTAAQLYLNYIEDLGLINRKESPVYHRERWHPMVIRRSQRNSGSAALLTIGMDKNPVIGQQTDEVFLPGAQFEIGGFAQYANMVNYPVDNAVVDVITCVTDSIIDPQVILSNGTHILVRDSTVFFLNGTDPFENSGFPRRTIVDDDGNEDEEILLWGCDALFDKDFVYNHLGYALGVKTESNEFFHRMLNGLWNIYNSGTALSVFWSGLGALLGEPTVIHTTEIVDRILEIEGKLQVVTDKEVYTVNPDAVLRAEVVPGAVLRSGEFLTETLRVYDTLDPLKMAGSNEYGERLRDDVPAMFLDRTLFTSDLGFGIAVNWELTDIVNYGADANGNPRLRFDAWGSDDDVDRFWEDTWDRLEAAGVSSETCFSDYTDDIVIPTEGAVYGRVAPLEYFMRYFLRANAFIVVVDRDRLASREDGQDAVALLTLLKDVIPAHVLMFIVEQRTVGPDEYDLDEDAEVANTDASVVEQFWAKAVMSVGTEGGPTTTHLTYQHREPQLRWIPQGRGV